MKKLISNFIAFSVLIFLFSACSDKQKEREIIFTKNAPAPIGPYSQAVKVGNTLYVSGQIGLTPEGILDTSSIESECRQAMNNIKAVIESSGMNMQHVVKSTLYLKDLNHFSKINEVYGSFFADNPPARETIEVNQLPKGANFEISVVAVN